MINIIILEIINSDQLRLWVLASTSGPKCMCFLSIVPLDLVFKGSKHPIECRVKQWRWSDKPSLCGADGGISFAEKE